MTEKVYRDIKIPVEGDTENMAEKSYRVRPIQTSVWYCLCSHNRRLLKSEITCIKWIFGKLCV